MVELISSSVIESKAEVASSKIKSFGFRNIARAIDKRCFSPPDTFIPPSPMVELSPFSARFNKFVQLALSKASYNSESVASGFTNNKFSRIVPENNCASCVTKPNCWRKCSKLIAFELIELYKTSPVAGGYNPTKSFTNVVFPAPEGPTKATVCPCLIWKSIFSTAG